MTDRPIRGRRVGDADLGPVSGVFRMEESPDASMDESVSGPSLFAPGVSPLVPWSVDPKQSEMRTGASDVL